MQQNRNMLLFIVMSIAIFVGWTAVQKYFWPRQPADKIEKKDVKATPPIDEKEAKKLPIADNVLAALNTVLSQLPVNEADPWRLTMELKSVEKWLPAKPTPPVVKPEVIVKEVKPPPAAKEPTVIGLGGPRHHIEARLTTRGAGVQKLVLTKFRAANYLGRPYTGDFPDAKLELIPEDGIRPSFQMYHYDQFGPEAVPVDTLGKLLWKLDKPAAPDDLTQEARFSVNWNGSDWTEVDEPGKTLIHITKTYTLEPGAYHIGMALAIVDRRDKGDKVPFRYQLTGARGIPVEGEWFVTSPRSAVIGTVDAGKSLKRVLEDSQRISLNAGGTRVPAAELGPESFIEYAGVMNQFFCSLIVVDDKQVRDDRRFLAWARPTLESSEWDGDEIMTGVIREHDDDFLTLQLITPGRPRGFVQFKLLPRVLKHIKEMELVKDEKVIVSFFRNGGQRVATWIRRGFTPRGSLDDITVRVHSQDISLKPGDKIEHKYLLYNGPSKVKLLGQFNGDASVPPDLLKRYDETLHLHTVIDFGSIPLWSALITYCTNFMHFLLGHLRFLGGDGLSIVMLTVLVRGLMFPVSRKQAIYSVKMQELAPEMKKIQEKFKSDPRARTEAIMEMYRKYNVHPLGGCLPILLQMPIFIGLYFALQESVHFRLATFLWIENLAAPDMLFWWSESIPIISDPNNQGGVVMGRSWGTWLSTLANFLYLGPFFNLLPVIAVTFMIIQQKVMTPPPQDEQQAAQFKMMRYMMVVIGIMFYKVAAGLAMYIIISTVWGLAERRFLPKKKTALVQSEPPPPGGQRSGPSGKKQPPKVPPKKPAGNVQKVKNWWQEVLKQAKKK